MNKGIWRRTKSECMLVLFMSTFWVFILYIETLTSESPFQTSKLLQHIYQIWFVHFLTFPLSLKLGKDIKIMKCIFQNSWFFVWVLFHYCHVTWRILGNSGVQYSRYAGTTSHSSYVWYQSLVGTYYTHIHKREQCKNCN